MEERAKSRIRTTVVNIRPVEARRPDDPARPVSRPVSEPRPLDVGLKERGLHRFAAHAAAADALDHVVLRLVDDALGLHELSPLLHRSHPVRLAVLPVVAVTVVVVALDERQRPEVLQTTAGRFERLSSSRRGRIDGLKQREQTEWSANSLPRQASTAGPSCRG
ncbi:unnamed protein product [Protopolystoma xenopodis]|uniref:Uncharacterized protein n=1 Tax=Protopolystoma xenopodis TaxID=117903 RepID=A0A3S5CT79_9PLAT|nr:unnamed protein product [Protopolystoma xenopodis]